MLGYTAKVLEETQTQLADAFAFQYVFVDDASADGTWDCLQALFGGREDTQLIRHPENRGVAAAILTGLRAAKTEHVASVDCDCTYDPAQLRYMIPLLDQDTAMVTASPYHPEGQVLGVPGWRLVLSRTLSRLYGWVLPRAPATITSCFRVYRRSRLLDIELEDGGFLGVAETLAVLSLRGEGIAEHPAVLESRLLGESKMRIVRTIFGHLGLLRTLAGRRLAGSRGA